MRARLLHYYGFKEEGVNTMPMSKVVDYNTCIDIMQAKDGLLAIQTSNYSKYKSNTQQKIMRRLSASANGLIKKEKHKLANYTDVVRVLQGMLTDGRRSD